MRKVLIIALLFLSCQQQETQKKSPYDFASQQQLSYLSKFMAFRDSLKLSTSKVGIDQVNNNYQKWAIRYWKDNTQIDSWLLQVKEINSNDTAAFFTLTDYSIPVYFVSEADINSQIYNTIKAIPENAFVLATGKIKSSPSFGNSNDTILQRAYFDAVFNTIINMNDSAQ